MVTRRFHFCAADGLALGTQGRGPKPKLERRRLGTARPRPTASGQSVKFRNRKAGQSAGLRVGYPSPVPDGALLRPRFGTTLATRSPPPRRGSPGGIRTSPPAFSHFAKSSKATAGFLWKATTQAIP